MGTTHLYVHLSASHLILDPSMVRLLETFLYPQHLPPNNEQTPYSEHLQMPTLSGEQNRTIHEEARWDLEKITLEAFIPDYHSQHAR